MEMQPEPDSLEKDINLLKRISTGDRVAFAELYDRLSNVLFAAAYRVLNQREAAEDVLQEVFLQIWQKAPLYQPALGKPLTWALTLTRNKSIDRLRSLQRRDRLQNELEEATPESAERDERNSFDALASSEDVKLVRQGLSQLAPDQRLVLELAFFHFMSQSEIAEKLQEPLGTIKARIRRAMAKLRTIVDELEGGGVDQSQPSGSL